MIAPSILSCDFTNIKKDFDLMNEEKVDFIHVDIMDGVYVPNISFGQGITKSLNALTNIPFDVHLMIMEPEKYIEDFAKAGASVITIHPNATRHLNRTLNLIKSFGIKVGIAINPSESLDILDYTLDDLDLVLIMSVNPGFGGQSFIGSSLKKIEEVRKIINDRKTNCLIEVDGGIKISNAKAVFDAGADIVVSGSGIFGEKNPREAIRKFKELSR